MNPLIQCSQGSEEEVDVNAQLGLEVVHADLLDQSGQVLEDGGRLGEVSSSSLSSPLSSLPWRSLRAHCTQTARLRPGQAHGSYSALPGIKEIISSFQTQPSNELEFDNVKLFQQQLTRRENL